MTVILTRSEVNIVRRALAAAAHEVIAVAQGDEFACAKMESEEILRVKRKFNAPKTKKP